MTSTTTEDLARAAREEELRAGLSDDELAAAEQAGMTPERYAALKDGATLEEWQRLAQGGDRS